MPTAAQTWTGDDFHVAIDRRSGVDVVSVRGELDIATSSRLRDVVVDAQRVPQPGMLVDLSRVSFLDSTGIGTLVAAWRHALAEHQRFGLVCPPGQPLRVLGLVHLDHLLEIWPTYDEAAAVLDLG